MEIGAPAWELREVFAVLGKWKAIMAVVVASALVVSGLTTFLVLPKVYQATATIDVGALFSAQANASATGVGQATNLQAVAQAVTNLPIVTFQTLQWELTSPQVLDTASRALSAHGRQVAGGIAPGVVSSGQLSGTQLMTVSATSHSPGAATAIANAVASAFVARENADREAQLTNAVRVLQAQEARVGRQLQAASTVLTAAEEQPAAAAASSNALSSDGTQLATLQAAYAQARVQLASAQAAEASLASHLHGIAPTVSTTVKGTGQAVTAAQPNPAYGSLLSEIDSQKVKVAEDQAAAASLQKEVAQTPTAAAASTGPTGAAANAAIAAEQAYQTALVTLRSDTAGLNEMEHQLAATPATLAAAPSSPSVTVGPNPVYQALVTQLDQQQVAVAEQQAAVAELSGEIAPLQQQMSQMQVQSTAAETSVAADKTQVDNLSAAYQTLAANVTKAQVAAAVSSGSAMMRVDEPASAPGFPISPRKKLDMALALLIGVVLAVALAFLLEQLDNTIKTAEDVRRVAGLPTLAVIPIARG